MKKKQIYRAPEVQIMVLAGEGKLLSESGETPSGPNANFMEDPELG
ncbi:MAG: hypothetical protein IJ081_03535 [Prevotella sp.]|nr:hypothetical protein [Prevotella sp.]